MFQKLQKCFEEVYNDIIYLKYMLVENIRQQEGGLVSGTVLGWIVEDGLCVGLRFHSTFPRR